MKINHHIFIIISPLLLLLCSCMPRYTLDFKTVDFTHIAPDKTDFDAKVWVSCKWFRSFTLTDIKYQLYVKNLKVGEGEYPGAILLGKKADTLLSFPCTVKNQDVALPLIGALLKGDFDYEVKMNFMMKAWIFKKRTNLEYSGVKKVW